MRKRFYTSQQDLKRKEPNLWASSKWLKEWRQIICLQKHTQDPSRSSHRNYLKVGRRMQCDTIKVTGMTKRYETLRQLSIFILWICRKSISYAQWENHTALGNGKVPRLHKGVIGNPEKAKWKLDRPWHNYAWWHEHHDSVTLRVEYCWLCGLWKHTTTKRHKEPSPCP